MRLKGKQILNKHSRQSLGFLNHSRFYIGLVLIFLVTMGLYWPVLAQNKQPNPQSAKNINSEALVTCSTDPMTGFYRDGKCDSGPEDRGIHVVCAKMTREFLNYTKSKGNDLITPNLAYGFPGLEPGDQWCVCAGRWYQAKQADLAPPVILDATNMKALEIIDRTDLEAHAFEG
jgi:hypothetical protein